MEEKSKGGGMPNFKREHWERSVSQTDVGNDKYSSEMNQEEEYKKSVDGLANYVKKHREQH